MGAGNRVRNSEAWASFGAIYVRDTTWKSISRAWARESNLWKLVYTLDQPPSIKCASLLICEGSGNPGCDTLSGCTYTGEPHRIMWSFTGSATGYHACIHRSIGGGAFVEYVDNQALDGGEPDVGCCTDVTQCAGADGGYIAYQHKSADISPFTCTTNYQYRVRAEINGTDTQVGSSQDTETDNGCDATCIA